MLGRIITSTVHKHLEASLFESLGTVKLRLKRKISVLPNFNAWEICSKMLVEKFFNVMTNAFIKNENESIRQKINEIRRLQKCFMSRLSVFNQWPLSAEWWAVDVPYLFSVQEMHVSQTQTVKVFFMNGLRGSFHWCCKNAACLKNKKWVNLLWMFLLSAVSLGVLKNDLIFVAWKNWDKWLTQFFPHSGK